MGGFCTVTQLYVLFTRDKQWANPSCHIRLNTVQLKVYGEEDVYRFSDRVEHFLARVIYLCIHKLESDNSFIFVT